MKDRLLEFVKIVFFSFETLQILLGEACPTSVHQIVIRIVVVGVLVGRCDHQFGLWRWVAATAATAGAIWVEFTGSVRWVVREWLVLTCFEWVFGSAIVAVAMLDFEHVVAIRFVFEFVGRIEAVVVWCFSLSAIQTAPVFGVFA